MEKLGKKLKHDHTLTSILKFTMFAMVMLAPIFSVASRCLYVICNKNAKDSYSNNYVEKLTEVNSTSMFQEYNKFQINYYNSTGINAVFNVHDTNLYDYIDTNNRTITTIAFVNESYARLNLTYSNGDGQRIDNWNNFTTSFVFTLNSTSFNLSNNITHAKLYLITVINNSLDNAFEYSLSQLQESSYYNWATNLGIYTPIHNMVSGLGGHDIIALLLAYWSIYTAIYIVFDIIIVCFVKITHMIQGE